MTRLTRGRYQESCSDVVVFTQPRCAASVDDYAPTIFESPLLNSHEIMSTIRTFATALLVGALGGGASVSHAQPTPLTPSAATFAPASPEEFEPVSVVVDFSASYCVAATTPLFSSVKLDGATLTLLLSHLKGGGPCVSRRSFQIGGLPSGSYTVKIGITGSYTANYPSGTRESVPVELGMYALTVRAVGTKVPVHTWVYEDAPSQNFPSMSLGYYWPSAVSSNYALVNSTSEPEFYTWDFRSARPANTTPLYILSYPAPLSGAFATASLDEAKRLISDGFAGRLDADTLRVMPVRNGVCPLGSATVYRLFNPSVIAHRYVTSADMYSALGSNGWVGEGAVFCGAQK